MSNVNPTMARNRQYTEHFHDGMRAAGSTVIGKLSRAEVNAIANKLPVTFGDAFLAGYYAELRRMRVAYDGPMADFPAWLERNNANDLYR